MASNMPNPVLALLQHLGLQRPLKRWDGVFLFYTILSLASFAEAWGWPFEVLAHFRLQAFVLGVGVLLGLIWSAFHQEALILGWRRWLWRVVTMDTLTDAQVLIITVMILCHGSVLLSFPGMGIIQPSVRKSLPGIETTRLTAMNVWARNTKTDKVLGAVKTLNPDVLLLIEITPRWHQQLWRDPRLRKTYPYRWWSGKQTQLAVLSKTPLTDLHLIDMVDDQGHKTPYGTAMEGTLRLNGALVSLVLVHTSRPTDPTLYEAYRQNLETLTRRRPFYYEGLVMMGDFNATSYTSVMQGWMADLSLTDSLLTSGVQPSWPTFFPLAYIPIDHAFVRSPVVVMRRQTGPHVGSDHLPVTIDITTQASLLALY